MTVSAYTRTRMPYQRRLYMAHRAERSVLCGGAARGPGMATAPIIDIIIIVISVVIIIIIMQRG